MGYTAIAFNQTVNKKVDPKTHVNILDILLKQLKSRKEILYMKRLTIILDEDSEKGFGLVGLHIIYKLHRIDIACLDQRANLLVQQLRSYKPCPDQSSNTRSCVSNTQLTIPLDCTHHISASYSSSSPVQLEAYPSPDSDQKRRGIRDQLCRRAWRRQRHHHDRCECRREWCKRQAKLVGCREGVDACHKRQRPYTKFRRCSRPRLSSPRRC